MDANYLMMLEKMFNLPAGILPAMSHAESNDNPRAVSPKGALGQYQIMPATAKELGVNPMDPEQAAYGAAQYLAKIRDQIGSNDPRMLAAGYNAGPGAVQKHGGIPPYPETMAYAQKVAGSMPADTPDPGAVKWDDAPDAGAVKWDDQPNAKVAAKAPPADPNPAWQAPSTGIGGRALMGLGDFLRPAGRAIVSGLAAGADQLAPGSDFGKQAHEAVSQIDANTASQNAKFAARQQAEGTTVPGTDLVRTAASMAPAFAVPMGAAETMGGRALMGAAAGAEMGAAGTQPGESYAKNAALGGAVGGVASGAVDALGRVVRGANLRPAVRTLVDQGVTPTPGQALGGIVNSFEQKLSSIPIAGEGVAAGRRAAVEDMNRALYQQVLDPIGGQAPREVGRDAVGQVARTVSDEYDRLLPQLSMSVDNGFRTDMQQLVPDYATLPAGMRDQFDTILNNAILLKNSRLGVLDGQALKDAESALGQRATAYMSSPDPDHRMLGSLLQRTQTAMRDALARQNPGVAPQLQAVNQAYGRLTVLQNAAAKVANPENPIMPGQLQQAVRKGDSTIRDRAFGAGQARLQQEVSDPAMAVLGASIPDSGTAGRLMFSHGLLAGAPAMLGHPLLGAALLGTNAAYSTNAGRQALFALLARRPDLVRSLGNGIQTVAPNAGAAAGFLSGTRQQPARP